MCLFCGLPTLLIVGSVYPPLNTDHTSTVQRTNESVTNMCKEKVLPRASTLVITLRHISPPPPRPPHRRPRPPRPRPPRHRPPSPPGEPSTGEPSGELLASSGTGFLGVVAFLRL